MVSVSVVLVFTSTVVAGVGAGVAAGVVGGLVRQVDGSKGLRPSAYGSSYVGGDHQSSFVAVDPPDPESQQNSEYSSLMVVLLRRRLDSMRPG